MQYLHRVSTFLSLRPFGEKFLSLYISRIAFKNFQYFLKYPIKLKTTCIPILNPGVKDTNIDTDKSKNKNIYNKYNNNNK